MFSVLVEHKSQLNSRQGFCFQHIWLKLTVCATFPLPSLPVAYIIHGYLPSLYHLQVHTYTCTSPFYAPDTTISIFPWLSCTFTVSITSILSNYNTSLLPTSSSFLPLSSSIFAHSVAPFFNPPTTLAS